MIVADFMLGHHKTEPATLAAASCSSSCSLEALSEAKSPSGGRQAAAAGSLPLEVLAVQQLKDGVPGSQKSSPLWALGTRVGLPCPRLSHAVGFAWPRGLARVSPRLAVSSTCGALSLDVIGFRGGWLPVPFLIIRTTWAPLTPVAHSVFYSVGHQDATYIDRDHLFLAHAQS